MKKIILFTAVIALFSFTAHSQSKQFIVDGNSQSIEITDRLDTIQKYRKNEDRSNEIVSKRAFSTTNDVSKSLYIANPGDLESLLTDNELNTITNLTLSGNIDYRDCYTMRDKMPELKFIDMENTHVKGRSGNTYGQYGNYYPYDDNIFPPEAFCNKTSLGTIILPKNITSNGLLAFAGCINLSNVTLPEGLEMITNSSFGECDNLTSIKIPTSVKYLYAYAFRGCDKLDSIDLSENTQLYEIGESVFKDCIALDNIILPKYLNVLWKYWYNGQKLG